MNYLVVAERAFPDCPGGAYRVAWELALLARDAGHRVRLLAGSTHADPPPGQSLVDGIEVVRYRFPGINALPFRRYIEHANAAKVAALTYCAGIDWHLIHAHSPLGAQASFGLTGPDRRLYTMHSPAVLEQLANTSGRTLSTALRLGFGLPALYAQERLVLSRASTIHVLSNYTASLVRRLYGPTIASKVTKVPWWAPEPVANPVNRSDARAQLGWASKGPTLLTVRRLVRRMGIDVLLTALGRVPRTLPWSLFVIGDGPERASLERLAEQVGVDDRVHFVGRVSDAELELAYRSADLFLLPTRSLECFGIITLEALARGVPVLASSVGAIPETVGPILPDWLVPPDDPAQLAATLERYLSGRQRPPSPSALQQYCEHEYGRARIADQYLRLLTESTRRG